VFFVDPATTAAAMIRRLEEQADPRFAEGQFRYFQEAVRPIGVRGHVVKQVAGEAWRAVHAWGVNERNRFMTELWKDGRLESGAVVCHAYRRFAKQCGAQEFELFEQWIDRFVNNWAHCDGVASFLVAACVENEPALRKRLIAWTGSANRWKRRAAAVSLVPEARKGRSTGVILDIAGRLSRDEDDMVRKGLGWLLKDAWPKRPGEVSDFLEEHVQALPRLVLRIAMEKMTPEGRKALREATRA
jgi:3-methyladenine DNA glycosylase AlkD